MFPLGYIFYIPAITPADIIRSQRATAIRRDLAILRSRSSPVLNHSVCPLEKRQLQADDMGRLTIILPYDVDRRRSPLPHQKRASLPRLRTTRARHPQNQRYSRPDLPISFFSKPGRLPPGANAGLWDLRAVHFGAANKDSCRSNSDCPLVTARLRHLANRLWNQTVATPEEQPATKELAHAPPPWTTLQPSFAQRCP
jgi:hypothetical protein